MRASDILRKVLGRFTDQIHAARFAAVLAAVDGIVRGGRASLTEIGRSLDSPTTAKHRIKRVDRLLGNPLLQRESTTWFRALIQSLGLQRLVLLVDWTHLHGPWQSLSAAAAFSGRALPLFHQVHRSPGNGNYRIYARFLRGLRALFPDGDSPVLVVDAGFCSSFFDACLEYGFDFIVRLRGRGRLRSHDCYLKASDALKSAGSRPRRLGCFAVYDSLRKGQTLNVVLAAKPRARLRSGDPYYRKRALTPWILATSLLDASAEEVIALYATRMQIEETFRDVKNPRFGWSLSHAGNRCPKRLEVLLLITTLALVVVMLLGVAAEASNCARFLQANTLRRRRVLSVFRLGTLIFNDLIARRKTLKLNV